MRSCYVGIPCRIQNQIVQGRTVQSQTATFICQRNGYATEAPRPDPLGGGRGFGHEAILGAVVGERDLGSGIVGAGRECQCARLILIGDVEVSRDDQVAVRIHGETRRLHIGVGCAVDEGMCQTPAVGLPHANEESIEVAIRQEHLAAASRKGALPPTGGPDIALSIGQHASHFGS